MSRTDDIERARVIGQVMTDGSTAWNVWYTDPETANRISFGCESRAKAINLARAINETAWAEMHVVEVA